MSVSLVAAFSSGGCKRVEPPVEEPDEEEVTEEAVVQIPEGWKKFIGSGFELYLPEKWEGGSEEELNSIIEKLRDMGQDQLASQVEAGLSSMLFWAYDPDNPTTNVNILSEHIPSEYSEISLDEYMELSYKNVAEAYEESGYSFNIIEQNVVPLGNYEEVGRTIFEQTIMGIESKTAQYMIKSDSDFWILTFGTEPGEFEQNIQTFDKTVETFNIIE